jgi:phenylacetate-CoA ligase
MMDLDVTAIACTPSYLIHIPWSDNMRQHIEQEMGIDAYDIYGTSEISGPMFTECAEKDGIHVWSDTVITEIIDPDTGESLEPGQRGELVMTILKKEAMPMIRYRIKDLTSVIEEECACGRTSPRIKRITGRSDDMLIIRGINVFPSQVEHTLLRIPEVSGGQFLITVDRVGALDFMTVQVEIKPEAFSDKVDDMLKLKKYISSELKKYLNIAVEAELAAPGSLPRFEGKAKRVTDRRKML